VDRPCHAALLIAPKEAALPDPARPIPAEPAGRDPLPPAETIRPLWPALFAPTAAGASEVGAVLPAPDVSLAAFLARTVPGTPQPPWTGRAARLHVHFQRLQPEFAGRPYLALLCACTIVCLRRDAGDRRALTLFRRMLAETGPELAAAMNSRWLASICDTVVDTADNDTDRAAGMIGSVFVSTLKLAETEIRLYHPPRPWPPQARLRAGGEIGDGLQTLFTPTSGDIDNILTRIERGLQIASPLRPILTALFDRALAQDSFLSRMVSLSGQARLPLAPAERVDRLRRIMTKL